MPALDINHDTDLGCYAVKVRSRMEHTITGTLRNKGFDVLSPSYVDRKRYSDRVKIVSRALFPGYVFVRTDAKKLLPLVSTEGVSYIVKTGNALKPLPHKEVQALQSLCNLEEACAPCERLTVGLRVVITAGPFEGLEGILKRVGNSERLVVSIDSIFSSVSVDLSGSEVKRVN
jgi:transcription antitermination factor NusG